MSIKTDAQVIRDETVAGANTATRVGQNLVDIADDLIAKQDAIDLNTAKISFDATSSSKLAGISAGAEVNPDVVSQAEAEAGVATTERIWTAQRVKQAIDALAPTGGSVDDTAYGVSWNGETTVAPSKNALYDFIESQVFKVDANSNIIPVFWGGTQAEYDADFPAGHPSNYFVVITDGVVTPLDASDIANTPSGNLVATDVQSALNELQSELDGALTTTAINTLSKVNTIITDATLIDTTDSRLSDARTPTAHTHTASEITDFDTEVSNNTDVAANTAKVSNVTHTGEVIGSTTLTVDATAVSNKTLKSTLAGTEEVLINDAGTLKKTTTQDIADLGGGGTATVQVATYTWTNPIFTGGTTPSVDIIPAQGVGKGIIVIGGGATHTSPFSSYTGNSVNLEIQWSNATVYTYRVQSVVTTSGSSKSGVLIPLNSPSSSLMDNVSIIGKLNNIGTDQTLTGAITLWVTYIVVDL